MTGLYLLHFEPRYQHAGHYLGWAKDVDRRVHEHLSGSAKASPLVRAALAAGCTVTLAATMPGDRTEERRLKNRGGLGRSCCPTCRTRLAAQRQAQAQRLAAQRAAAHDQAAADELRHQLFYTREVTPWLATS